HWSRPNKLARVSNLVSDSFRRHSLCGNLRHGVLRLLCSGFLDRLLRRLGGSLHRHILGNNPFPDNLLQCGFLSFGTLQRKPLFGGGDDCCPTSTTQLPLGLRGFGRGLRRRRLGLLLRFGPSLALGVTDALPGACTHFSPFAFWNFRRGGGWFGATVQHLPDLRNL